MNIRLLILLTAFVAISGKAFCHQLTSIVIDDTEYNLLIFEDSEKPKYISFFNKSLLENKIAGEITRCSLLIGLPAGTAKGSDLYGAYCTHTLENKSQRILICKSDFFGSFDMGAPSKKYGVTLNEIISFSIDNCKTG